MKLIRILTESHWVRKRNVYIRTITIANESYTIECEDTTPTLSISFTHEVTGMKTRVTSINAITVLRAIAREVADFIHDRLDITTVIYDPSGLGTREGERTAKARIYQKLLTSEFPMAKFLDYGSYIMVKLNRTAT